MLLSPEIELRLEEEKDFLQAVALLLARRLVVVENRFSVEEFAQKVDCSPSMLGSWLLESSTPGYRHSWRILQLADEDFLPIEWIIRGDLLNEYNDEKRVPLFRQLIKEIGKRVEKEGDPEDDGEKQIYLLVSSGSLAFLELGSWTGPYKIWINLRTLRENYQVNSQRIDPENRFLGGLWDLTLPTEPKALNIATLATYVVGHDHTFTIRDVEELIRWVKDGEKIDRSYIDQLEKNTWAREAVS
jgi:transcriptional regulator with XRE-family HTH domain